MYKSDYIMSSEYEEIAANEREIAALQRKNKSLKCEIVLRRFSAGKRCRVTLEFDDGHNGATKRHHLLARVAHADTKWVQITFDRPYRFVSGFDLPCVDLFTKYLHDCNFFTQQGFAQVVCVVPLARKQGR